MDIHRNIHPLGFIFHTKAMNHQSQPAILVTNLVLVGPAFRTNGKDH